MPKFKAVIHYEGFVEFEVEAENEADAKILAEAEFDGCSPAELEAKIVNIDADVTEVEEDEDDG